MDAHTRAKTLLTAEYAEIVLRYICGHLKDNGDNNLDTAERKSEVAQKLKRKIETDTIINFTFLPV